jgi:hypothetical protein
MTMTEVYAVFTTGTDLYDSPELFALYASVDKAEADAEELRTRRYSDYYHEGGELAYSKVSVTYVPIR